MVWLGQAGWYHTASHIPDKPSNFTSGNEAFPLGFTHQTRYPSWIFCDCSTNFCDTFIFLYNRGVPCYRHPYSSSSSIMYLFEFPPDFSLEGPEEGAVRCELKSFSGTEISPFQKLPSPEFDDVWEDLSSCIELETWGHSREARIDDYFLKLA